jgi:hypothetical protein
MIKIRGPFASEAQASEYVAFVAGQGASFREYVHRSFPNTSFLGRGAVHTVTFAIFEDSGSSLAGLPDEHIEWDPALGAYVVSRD